MGSFRTNDNITLQYIDTAATDADPLKKETLILVRCVFLSDPCSQLHCSLQSTFSSEKPLYSFCLSGHHLLHLNLVLCFLQIIFSRTDVYYEVTWPASPEILDLDIGLSNLGSTVFARITTQPNKS
jgi:hypothetical protein